MSVLDLSTVREWANASDRCVGKRGRLPRSVIVEFLLAHPRTSREIAATLNIATPARGRLGLATAESIAAAL